MYIDNRNRTATVIYLTFGCMTVGTLLLGILHHGQFFMALFFWWLLLGLILVSRWASRILCRRNAEQRLSIEQGRPYRIKRGCTFGLVLLIALPFYYVWLGVSFISCLHPYAPLALDLPILILSFLAFGYAFPIWKDLQGRGWVFWGVHVIAYALIQILGRLLRAVFLAEFYGA